MFIPIDFETTLEQQAAVRVAKRVLKSGDRVIFMTVLPLQV